MQPASFGWDWSTYLDKPAFQQRDDAEWSSHCYGPFFFHMTVLSGILWNSTSSTKPLPHLWNKGSGTYLVGFWGGLRLPLMWGHQPSAHSRCYNFIFRAPQYNLLSHFWHLGWDYRSPLKTSNCHQNKYKLRNVTFCFQHSIRKWWVLRMSGLVFAFCSAGDQT